MQLFKSDKVCSPQNPGERSMYGESGGVSSVFLRLKLNTAVGCVPTVPTVRAGKRNEVRHDLRESTPQKIEVSQALFFLFKKSAMLTRVCPFFFSINSGFTPLKEPGHRPESNCRAGGRSG